MYSGISTVASHSQSPQDRCIRSPDSAFQLHASSAEGIVSYAFMLVSHECLGVCPGLVLAPMTYAREAATGIPFVPNMALGVLITAPFVTVGLILAGQAPWRLYTKAAAIPGVLAGCLWNAGNVSSFLSCLKAICFQMHAGPRPHSRRELERCERLPCINAIWPDILTAI